MLTGLLSTIQEQLFSKGFLIVGLFPTVLFIAANGWLLQDRSPAVAQVVAQFGGAEDKTLAYALVLSVLMAVSLLLSNLATTLLEVLEGKRPPVRWLAPWLVRGQHRRLQQLYDGYHRIVVAMGTLQRSEPRWRSQLEEARQLGDQPQSSDPPEAQAQRRARVAAATRVATRLRQRMLTDRIVLPDEVELAVNTLCVAFRDPARDDTSLQALDDADATIASLVRYAEDRLQAERIRLHTLRQFNYPGAMDPPAERSTHNLLAPTRAGNIARTMRSYAITRYNLDLDIFWTRLQKSLQQASPDYFGAVQDAKIQVDALVVLSWLAAAFTAIWAVSFVFLYPSKDAFLVVALAGPIVTRALYDASCERYRVFADLVRGCVDLFRFELLTDLHFRLPYGIVEEQTLWKDLGDRTAYDDETWRPIYSHPEQG